MYLKIAVSSEIPLWTSLICLAAGLALSWVLYRKKKFPAEISSPIRYLLFVVRAFYLSVLFFLLISPFVLMKDPVVEKPILIFGQDKSMSVAALTDSSDLTKYVHSRDKFLEELKNDFDVHVYDFGEKVEKETGGNFNHRLTDFSEFFKTIADRYENRNVSLMVLSSDGLYNLGENPMYASAVFDFPVYGLALGDTNRRCDLWVDKIQHNKMAFLGNTFDIKISVGASLLNGKKSKLTISRKGKIYHSGILDISRDDFIKTLDINLPADETGLLRFEVKLDVLDNEVTSENNQKYFYIDVLEDQQKILIVSSSPHPDVSALMSAINNSKNFKATGVLLKNFNGNMEGYNLVVLNQLPMAQLDKVTEACTRNNTALLFILGKNTSIEKFNSLQTGLSFEQFRGLYNEVTPVLNDDFHYFSINRDKSRTVEELPPLIAPFATYNLTGNAGTLFYQKIGKVETNYPLVTFLENDGKKTGIIAGEGIWRWRLYDYRINGSSDYFDEFIQKIVRYLSVAEDKSRFRLSAEAAYFENNNVVISAEYYDKSFELNNESEAEFYLTNEEGEKFEYNFLKTGKIYQVDLGKLTSGEYKWVAVLNNGTEKFERTGNFSIKALQLENNALRADHSFLFNLSRKLGGELLYPDDLNEFAGDIRKMDRFKPVIHYTEQMKELISFKWLFVLFLILLSMEWSMRKWFGLN